MSSLKKLPEIHARRQVAKSRLFSIEEVDLTFSNGEKRVYERMQGTARGSVMVVPFIDEATVVLVREYCAGSHCYELGFPKGLIDPGETPEQAANRELKEEIGFGAESLSPIIEVALAPAFFSGHMSIFKAQFLYEETLPGDEPEPLEVIKWPIADYKQLLASPEFNEARSIAALMLIVDSIREQE
ncbi:ADP compounds hydrolase NudE [Thalassotalea fusca]